MYMHTHLQFGSDSPLLVPSFAFPYINSTTKVKGMVHLTFQYTRVRCHLVSISANTLIAFPLNLFLIKCSCTHCKIMQRRMEQRKTSGEVYD